MCISITTPCPHGRTNGDDSPSPPLLLRAIALLVGVFCPVVSVPIVGNLNYIGTSKAAGVLVLACGAMALVFAITDEMEWAWSAGLPALGAVGFSCYQYYAKIADMRASMDKELAGNPFAGLAKNLTEVIQPQWGLAVMFIGGVLVTASTFLPAGEERSSMREIRVCPSCAEYIRRAALKCRYCGTDLPPLPSPRFLDRY